MTPLFMEFNEEEKIWGNLCWFKYWEEIFEEQLAPFQDKSSNVCQNIFTDYAQSS